MPIPLDKPGNARKIDLLSIRVDGEKTGRDPLQRAGGRCEPVGEPWDTGPGASGLKEE